MKAMIEKHRMFHADTATMQKTSCISKVDPQLSDFTLTLTAAAVQR